MSPVATPRLRLLSLLPLNTHGMNKTGKKRPVGVGHLYPAHSLTSSFPINWPHHRLPPLDYCGKQYHHKSLARISVLFKLYSCFSHRQKCGLEGSEVCQQHPVSARHQHVLALDIAVTNSSSVTLSRRPQQQINQPSFLDVRQEWPRRESIAERTQ